MQTTDSERFDRQRDFDWDMAYPPALFGFPTYRIDADKKRGRWVLDMRNGWTHASLRNFLGGYVLWGRGIR